MRHYGSQCDWTPVDPRLAPSGSGRLLGGAADAMRSPTRTREQGPDRVTASERLADGVLRA